MASQASQAGGSRVFPRRSVIILALVLTTNAYTLANLFPYIGTMVKLLLGLPTTNESGYYAGYVASSFTLGRFLTAYVWGSTADKIGRKPVLLIGLSSIMTCSVTFGLSTTFAMAIASRFILGLTNGIMPAVRTMVREICGPEHVVMGMNYVSGSRGIGLMAGTAIGGLLAQPANLYPDAFSASGLFGRYPFLLPNVFGASFALLLLPLVLYYLPETRNPGKPRAQTSPDRNPISHGSSGGSSGGGGGGGGGGRHRRDTSFCRRLSYQRLNGDAESEKVKQQQQQQQQPSPTRHSGNSCAVSPGSMVARGMRRGTSGAGSPTVGMIEFGSSRSGNNRRSGKGESGRYNLLEQGDNGVDEGGDDERSVGETVVISRTTDFSACDVCNTVFHRNPIGGGGGGDGDGDGDGSCTVGKLDEKEDGEEEGDSGVFGPRGLLSSPGVKMVLFVVAVVQMASIGFEEAYPLWALSTTDVGGLGWDTEQIGKVMGVTSIVFAVLNLGVFPRVIKRVGIVSWQRAGCLVAVPIFLAVPHARFLSWSPGSLFIVSVLSNVLVMFSISSIMLALTVASTSVVPEYQRGKLSGLFMTSESLGRFLGPAGFSIVFAWSISPSAPGWVDYRLVFLVPAAVMVLVAQLGWRMFALNLEVLTRPTDPSSPPLIGRRSRGAFVVGSYGTAAATHVPARRRQDGAGGSAEVGSPRLQKRSFEADV